MYYGSLFEIRKTRCTRDTTRHFF